LTATLDHQKEIRGLDGVSTFDRVIPIYLPLPPSPSLTHTHTHTHTMFTNNISLLTTHIISVGIFLHSIAKPDFSSRFLSLSYLFPLFSSEWLFQQAKIAYAHCILNRHDTLMTYTKRRFGRVAMDSSIAFRVDFGIVLTSFLLPCGHLYISLRRDVAVERIETSSKGRAQVYLHLFLLLAHPVNLLFDRSSSYEGARFH
jgi:hypothetical protein